MEHRKGPAFNRWEHVLYFRSGLHCYTVLMDYAYQAFYSEYRAPLVYSAIGNLVFELVIEYEYDMVIGYAYDMGLILIVNLIHLVGVRELLYYFTGAYCS